MRLLWIAFALCGCPRGADPPDWQGRPDAGDADADTDTDTGTGTGTDTGTDTVTETDTGPPDCDDPGSVTPGAPDRFLLRGDVVTPDEHLRAAEVLIEGGSITCVGDCSAAAGADGATIVETAGTIYPGLVDGHNHVDYDWLEPWTPPRLYDNHDQWQSSAAYDEFIAPFRDHEGEIACEMAKWGEIRALVGGTTTIQGTPMRRCIHWLVRNAEHYADLGLDTNQMRTNTLGISTVNDTEAATLRAQMDAGILTAYVIHLGEGLDEPSRSELDDLVALDLLTDATVVIHGTAFGDPEWAAMGAAGAKLVWSPRSNLVLYGDTTDVPAAQEAGVLVSIGADWTPSGSPSLLHELRAADAHDDAAWGDALSAQDLVAMATSDAARVLGLDAFVGRIAVGLRADLLVLGCAGDDPYRALVDARLGAVRLVFVDGVPLYGDEVSMAAAPQPFCEPFEACGVAKTLCLRTSEDPADGYDQTLGDVEAVFAGVGLEPWPLGQCD